MRELNDSDETSCESQFKVGSLCWHCELYDYYVCVFFVIFDETDSLWYQLSHRFFY